MVSEIRTNYRMFQAVIYVNRFANITLVYSCSCEMRCVLYTSESLHTFNKVPMLTQSRDLFVTEPVHTRAACVFPSQGENSATIVRGSSGKPCPDMKQGNNSVLAKTL